MPGRKIIFMLNSRPAVEIDVENLMTTNDEGMKEINFDNPSDDNSERYGGVLNRLADEALRAGVVFHTLDARGLCSSDTSSSEGLTPNSLADMGQEELCPIEPMYSVGMNALSYKTDGIFAQDNNFFLDGVGKKVNNMIAD